MASHLPCNLRSCDTCAPLDADVDADLLSHDDTSEEIFFTQSLHVEGLDERIAMFDETILPTPSLLEALDLARGRRRLPAPTYVAENHDFEA